MIDINSILIWQFFNKYNFEEKTHTYFYQGKKVKHSVTQFIHRFFEEFDKENISKKYAIKHGLNQQDVIDEWERSGKISTLSGTIIHSYLENAKRGKTLELDYSKAKIEGLYDEVYERVQKLLPKAEAFHRDTLNKLFPIQLEYTVGIEDLIAGNIDLLCWNEKAQEFQIWDYKNVKDFTTTNNYGKKCLSSFSELPDCHLTKYSIQLNMYKAILQRALNVKIGKCYLVQFNYSVEDDSFDIYECLDLQKECDIELNRLIEENRSYDNR